MQLAEFLSIVLPPEGDYYFAYNNGGGLKQNKVGSVSSLHHALVGKGLNRCDVYYATGTFGDKRTIKECHLKKVWYVDIDCKPGGQYPDKKSALIALKAATKIGLLPPSLIIDSGHGFHPYWVLDKAITCEQWRPVADGIIKMCEATGLEIDKGITTDAARILRVPETTNYKDPNNPLPCKILTQSHTIYTLETVRSAVKDYTGPTIVTSNANVNDDLTAGLEGQSEPPPALGMLEQCPLFANELATQGKDTSGVIWHKLIHTLAYTSDGESYIHEISKGHDDYTPNKVEARFEHAVAQREKMGAVLCEKFEEAGATQCATCPLHGKGKSPITYAFRSQKKELLNQGQLPFPFRNMNGTVERKEGEDWAFYLPSDVTDFSVSHEPGVDSYFTFNYKQKKVELPLTTLASGQTFHRVMAQNNVTVLEWEHRRILAVVEAFVNVLDKNRSASAQVVRHFGWVGKGFHAGGIVYGDSELTRKVRLDPNTLRTYQRRGEIAAWTKAANYLLEQKRPAAWTILASAFAAPLMPFTSLSGGLISIVSDASGSGKTTSLKLAQSVWGDATDGLSHLGDTSNAVMNRLGILCNLPSYWDEVRRDQVEAFIDQVFRLTQGKEKQRLNRDITARASGHWQTLMAVTTNGSILEHMTHHVKGTDAGLARVLEVEAEPITDTKLDPASALAMYTRAYKASGSAGAVYAEYLAANKPLIEAMVEKVNSQLFTTLKATGPQRYWVAMLTTLLVGAKLANKLNLTQFDLPVFRTYLIKTFREHQNYTDDNQSVGTSYAMNVLSEYMREMTDYTIHAETIPKTGMTRPTILTDSLRKPAVIRIAHKANAIRVAKSDFRQWVYNNHKTGGDVILKDLIAMGATDTRGSIDAGSPVCSGVRPRCLDIALTGPFSALQA